MITQGQGITLRVGGQDYVEWTSAEVKRDLKDFSGAFKFTLRDTKRSLATFPFATAGTAFDLKLGVEVQVLVDGELVLKGWIEGIDTEIEATSASVEISGRDKTGDLVDCAAFTTGPSEYNNVKLEDAAKRIAQPYGLGVRSEIDTGDPFTRYGLDLGETAFTAIEKGSRARHALVLSDGVGNIVITRTGAKRAPADLSLPGNVLKSKGRFGHHNRHSHHHVHGQGERAGKKRTGKPLDVSAEPLATADRRSGDGSATTAERAGTAAKGLATDSEITRYRPVVHLARAKADNKAAGDEADRRMRTSRAASESVTETVKDFRANGQLWRVNEIAYVSDSWAGIERDMLITRVTFRESNGEARVTELEIMSPEAFDAQPVGNRRRNGKGKKKKHSGPLDGTASGL
ncbi:phage baseplate assembly protein [Rhizobium mayense]|uniref:Mu P family protein n=1 Tax=Rhizobium mayense TaxID=1312184 RepID=A0ABT7JY28_9HYPH|nr:Mu P family protein [Rhizobium mayense]MDL2401247.1 Mu P family protein [Rhizobium mayense]